MHNINAHRMLSLGLLVLYLSVNSESLLSGDDIVMSATETDFRYA